MNSPAHTQSPKKQLSFVQVGICAVLLCVGALPAWAQTVLNPAIPNTADISRIKPEEKQIFPERTPQGAIKIPTPQNAAEIPEAAKKFRFVLSALNIHGATVYAQDVLETFYAEKLNTEITLDTVYQIASALTDRYRQDGYFLSRAYVPAQEIEKGIVRIEVVEGYIGAVDGLERLAQSDVVRMATDRIKAQRPIKAKTLESTLLLLNDLPGYAFGGTLSQLENAPDGAVKLTLAVTDVKGAGALSYDNYSSRFLGPDEITASYTTSLIDMHQTSISALSDTSRTKLRYGTIQHAMTVTPDMKVELAGGIVHATPGYTLLSSEIDSLSTYASFALSYKMIRQRDENLALKATLENRNITSDILSQPLTRDRIRTLRLNANYDVDDTLHGANSINATLSHGINWFGASNKGDAFLSRAGAVPDFTKLEMSYSRLQSVTNDWALYGSVAGQWASGILFSSEQFGYGGQSFGRAFDSSELTGDRGIKGSLEVRYSGWNVPELIQVQPYGFYDRGAVWNQAAGQPVYQLGSSVGVGMRFSTVGKQTGNIGLAWPMNRDIGTPIYNGSRSGPRITIEISQQF